MQYVIIGTDHDLQKADNPDKHLKTVLQGYITAYPIVLVAEEVDANHDVRTFGRELVGDSKWLSIDMDDQKRKDHGIYQELLHPPNNELDDDGIPYRVNAYLRRAEGIRENYWLDEISRCCDTRKVSDGVIIVTCGMNHLRSLAEKITARGHTVVKEDCYIPYELEKRWVF